MDPYQDPTWIPIWILYGSLCGSYMGRLYANVFAAVPKCQYSNRIFANVSGGLWEAAGALRGKFGESSGKVRGRFGEGSGRQRGGSGPAAGAPAPDPPVGILYGTFIIPLLEPSSELAIRELSQQSTLIAYGGARRGRSCGRPPGPHAAHICLSKHASSPIASRAGRPAVSNRPVRGRMRAVRYVHA